MAAEHNGLCERVDGEEDRRELWLMGRVRVLSQADDFSDTLNVLDRYPQISRRQTTFERDMRARAATRSVRAR